MGKLEEALPLIQLVLEGREKSLGANHPDTLISVNLASLLKAMGMLEEAHGKEWVEQWSVGLPDHW